MRGVKKINPLFTIFQNFILFLPFFIIFLIESSYLLLDFLVLNFYFYFLLMIISILNRYKFFIFILSFFPINISRRQFRSRKKNDAFDLWLSYAKIEQVFQFLHRLGYLQARDSFLIDLVYDFLINRQGWLNYEISWIFLCSNNIKGMTVNIYELGSFDTIVFVTLLWFLSGLSTPYLGYGRSNTNYLDNDINCFCIRDAKFRQISYKDWDNKSSIYLNQLGIPSDLIKLSKKFYTMEGV